MTLSDRIRLIDDLIKENSDACISDYLEALEEIVSVERASEVAFMEERLKEDRRIAFENANTHRDSRGRFIRRHQKMAS